MRAPALGKVVVVGVGLIGGSFALALKAAGAAATVVGVGRGASNLNLARKLGIADRTWTQDQRWTDELTDADLVLLATPVGQIPELLAAIAPALGRATVVTDAGSTKQDVIAAARRYLGAALPCFVPGHPIAGSERSGAAAASETLFRGRSVILTPLPETTADAQKRVADAWNACGGVVNTLEAARHDAIFAAVSHMPHALAFALVAQLAQRADAADYFRYAATGFRDFTRLASSDPEMWRDVCLGNATALRRELAAYRSELDRLDALLLSSDGDGLGALFERARDARDAWLARHRDDSD
ncbi:MAG TPA: prephenate dehydrogenase/arogenate dehydrogenase family protein [Casimicrobiaceae bacterium]|nr:prephenate dehydrogenase/arogenate dehydrogenase family protein [Casimicrobiaceae bacterium]